MADKEVISTRCYICDKNLKRKVKWFSTGGRNYISVAKCPQHGYMKGKIRLKKHALTESEEEHVYVDKTQKFIDAEMVDEILQKREKVLSSQQKRRETRKKEKPEDK